VLWGPFVRGARRLISDAWSALPGVSDPAGATIFKLGMAITYVNPIRIYETLVASLYLEPVPARLVQASFGERLAGSAVLAEGMPVYLTDAVPFVRLLAWLVVPFGVGYWIFREKDL
jgi:ABC-2 type transport system permease protein